MERTLHGVRPDISLFIRDAPVAIEVQNSTIDLKTIEARTKRYSELSIYLVWIVAEPFPTNTQLIEDEYVIAKPREWQKYVHALQFGRLYYWQRGAYLLPVHLGKYSHYVEPGNWMEENYQELEGTHWFEDNVDDANYGGYEKTSKTKRKIITPAGKAPKEEVHIVEDFRGTARTIFRCPEWTIPAGKIWIDTLPRWWS